MDKIGLVTVTYNSDKVLQPFLDCVWQQTHNKIILYVIDNLSNDNTIPILLNSKQERIKIIKNDLNVGVAKANNQGIKCALDDGCDQVLIINNDVVFESNLIESLIKVQKDYRCSLVSPKILFYDNPKNIWYAGSWFKMHRGYLPIHRGFEKKDLGAYDKIISVDYAPTCCLLVKKQVFLDVGFMDEKYFAYFDDTDFLYRVWKSKKHILYYYPFTNFYHKVGSLTKSSKKSSTQLKGDFYLKQFIKNQIYFLKKIGSFFALIYIVWLFFKNNLRFIFNARIKKNFSTWILINKAYFEGIKM